MSEFATPIEWAEAVSRTRVRVIHVMLISTTALQESRETLSRSAARLDRSGATLGTASRSLAAALPAHGGGIATLLAKSSQELTAGDADGGAPPGTGYVRLLPPPADRSTSQGAPIAQLAPRAPCVSYGLLALAVRAAQATPPGRGAIVPFPRH